MNAVIKRMMVDLDVRFGVDVKGLTRDGSRWRLLDAAGHALGEYEVAVVAVPAPQAAALVDPASYALASRIREVHMEPCWAVMAHFPQTTGVSWDGTFSHVGPLSWLSKDSSKPERAPESGESFVLHASAQWSRAHLELDPHAVVPMVLDAFYATTGVKQQAPDFITAHRWRYASTSKPLGEACLWDEGLQLAVCGDWCLGSRVEAAFLSGSAAAGRINALPGGQLEEQDPPHRPSAQLNLQLPGK